MTFNEDGTHKKAEYYYNTWRWEECGTWSYKNGKITVANNGETETASVKELTSSKLVIELIEKGEEYGIPYESSSRTEYRKISDQLVSKIQIYEDKNKRTA